MPRGIVNLVPLSFERTTDRDVHGDLLLKVGVYRHVCDSYYLAIDESPKSGDTIADGLARLLEQWVDQLHRIQREGGVAYLPFDFSDQCTAWLQVTCDAGSGATVQAGWSAIEGWSLNPSGYLGSDVDVPDFKPVVNASVTCALTDLIATVERNRTAISTGK